MTICLCAQISCIDSENKMLERERVCVCYVCVCVWACAYVQISLSGHTSHHWCNLTRRVSVLVASQQNFDVNS